MSEVDDLFGTEDAVRTNVGLVLGLLLTGLLFTALGMACTVLPGGVLILLGYHYAEREVDRVDSGYLPEAERPRANGLRRVAQVGVIALLLAIVVQLYLLSIGFYAGLWDLVIMSIRAIVSMLL